MMRRPKAVLFDFDGVIGRTMEDNSLAWKYAFDEVGLDFNEEEFYLAEGKKAHEYVVQVLTRSGRNDLQVEPLVEAKNNYYRNNSAFSFYESAEDLAHYLQGRGLRVGVVSGGSKTRLMSGPAKILLDTLDTVVTGDDVISGKPSPEAYLTASSLLGISPEDCLVIENAPLGIRAAKSAGMKCFAVCTTLPEGYLSEADEVFHSLSEVSDFLNSLIA